MCGRIYGQLAVSLLSSDWVTTGTTYCTIRSLFCLVEPFLSKLSPFEPFRWMASSVFHFFLSHSGETWLSRVTVGSVWRDPVPNKTRKRTSACDGVQIASLPRSLLCYRCSVRNKHCTSRLVWAVIHPGTWFPLIIAAARVGWLEFVICP